jgi:hypothetical protein
VEVRSEILMLESTINTTVDRLSFATEVTKVVREVGSGDGSPDRPRREVLRTRTDKVNELAGT